MRRQALGVRGLTLLALCASLVACQGPSVFVLHSPIQPKQTQPVSYTASANDPDGVASIEIWEERNELNACVNGQPCGRYVATTLLHTCSFTPPTKEASCTFTVEDGYPDRSLIGYRAVASDARGNREAEGWIYYAAGRFPWPDQPIPVYATGSPAHRLDLVFIPDVGYSGHEEQFVDEVTRLIHQAYLSTGPLGSDIQPWRGYWNFYLTYDAADVKGPDKGCHLPPGTWATLMGVVNAGAILHQKEVSDCIGVGEGSLFSVRAGEATTTAMAVHETAHTLFSLADEYCCDGGYWEALPDPNVFSSRARCRTYASARGWSPDECRQIGSPTFWRAAGMTGWWRIDADGDLMERTNSTSLFGTADRTRIHAIYRSCDGREGC